MDITRANAIIQMMSSPETFEQGLKLLSEMQWEYRTKAYGTGTMHAEMTASSMEFMYHEAAYAKPMTEPDIVILQIHSDVETCNGVGLTYHMSKDRVDPKESFQTISRIQENITGYVSYERPIVNDRSGYSNYNNIAILSETAYRTTDSNSTIGAHVNYSCFTGVERSGRTSPTYPSCTLLTTQGIVPRKSAHRSYSVCGANVNISVDFTDMMFMDTSLNLNKFNSISYLPGSTPHVACLELVLKHLNDDIDIRESYKERRIATAVSVWTAAHNVVVYAETAGRYVLSIDNKNINKNIQKYCINVASNVSTRRRILESIYKRRLSGHDAAANLHAVSSIHDSAAYRLLHKSSKYIREEPNALRYNMHKCMDYICSVKGYRSLQDRLSDAIDDISDLIVMCVSRIESAKCLHADFIMKLVSKALQLADEHADDLEDHSSEGIPVPAHVIVDNVSFVTRREEHMSVCVLKEAHKINKRRRENGYNPIDAAREVVVEYLCSDLHIPANLIGEQVRLCLVLQMLVYLRSANKGKTILETSSTKAAKRDFLLMFLRHVTALIGSYMEYGKEFDVDTMFELFLIRDAVPDIDDVIVFCDAEIIKMGTITSGGLNV